MGTWPSTLPPPSSGIDEEYYRPQERMDFEANYVQVASKSLRGKKRWPDFGWEILTETEYQILESFFDANQGGSFTFTHPITGVSHTCIFSADSVKGKLGAGGIRTNVRCPIEEL